MPRRATYPWFFWFDEDQHQIPRSRFQSTSEENIRAVIQRQARRMAVSVRIGISDKWVWIRAERISRNSLTACSAPR